MGRAFTTPAADSDVIALMTGATLSSLVARDRWRGFHQFLSKQPQRAATDIFIKREPIVEGTASDPSDSAKLEQEQGEVPFHVSELTLEALALEEPDEFLQLIASNKLGTADLTFAAEIAGSITNSVDVVPVLVRLLENPSPLVREGAVYGLSEHLSWSEQARRALRRHLTPEQEPSRGVRQAAKEALKLIA
ncbi:MAG TPA: HEAT repeat domain-containing protein [Vicinamibacteria bacterium]|nr:HEAT repeat domain-containing protein [Vicinamibacteria bacterium]